MIKRDFFSKKVTKYRFNRDRFHRSLVKNRENAGFSLIELIAVIVLLSILGLVAFGRLSVSTETEAVAFYDETVSAVGFAQKLAISTGCDVRVIMSAGGYQLRQSSACTADNFTQAVPNPANRAADYQSGTIPTGYSFTTGNITFNALGLREEATSVFTLTNGTDNYSFRVYSGSGLVEKL